MKIHFLGVASSIAVALSLGNTATAQMMVAGTSQSLALCSDSTVMAWGSHYYGQLGDGTASTPPYYSSLPVQVIGLTGVTAIAAGSYYSLALTSDSTVSAWGYNSKGALGIGVTGADGCSCGDANCCFSLPVEVGGLTGVVGISAGGYTSHVVKADGTVWSWGYNNYGQLGNGTTTNSNTPVQTLGLDGVIAIATGTPVHSLALRNDGTVWAWGHNQSGCLGNGTTIDSHVPVQVSPVFGGTITAIAGGNGGSLALKDDGTVWAWGGNVGNGTSTPSSVPVQVISLTNIIAIAGGAGHSLAVRNDGTVWTWGSNNYGQLGNGNLANTNVPVLVNQLTNAMAVAGGDYCSLARSNDGSVWAWGRNDSGQLGNGTSTISLVPVQVIGPCEISTEEGRLDHVNPFEVLPNPSSGLFRIEGLDMSHATSLEIRNTLGQEVHRSNIKSPLTVIDLTEQPDGIYFMTLWTSGTMITKRLIKQ